MDKKEHIADIIQHYYPSNSLTNNLITSQSQSQSHITLKQKEALRERKSTLLTRSFNYISKGFYNRAIKDSNRILELEPHNDQAKSFICISYLEMNDIIMAEQYLPSNKTLNNLFEKKRKEIIENQVKIPFYSKYLNFIKTLHLYDAYFPKIEINFSPNGQRGVVSKSPIEKNEIIMSIPKDCLITLDCAYASAFGHEISKFMYLELNSPKHCLLASFLLAEEHNPKWKFYFDMLPDHFDNFPIYYTQHELDLLSQTVFLSQLEEKKKEIRKDYDTLVALIPSYNQFTFDKFCKARMLIGSRIFGIKMNNKKIDILAPYADLLNHRMPRQTHWYYDEIMKAFIIQAMENIPYGMELYDSYGRKGNSRFLMHYGFTIENNDANEYPLIIEFNTTVPFYAEKEIWIKNTFDFKKAFTISQNLMSSSVIDMFSFLRFIVFAGNLQVLYDAITHGQNLPIDETMIPTFYYISPISTENEIDVLKLLKELCVKELGKYPTTIEEDMEMLNYSNMGLKPLTFNEKNCIVMRLSEKKVLKFYLDMAEYCIQLLRLNEKELFDTIITGIKYEDYEYYIQDVVWVLSKRSARNAISSNRSSNTFMTFNTTTATTININVNVNEGMNTKTDNKSNFGKNKIILDQ